MAASFLSGQEADLMAVLCDHKDRGGWPFSENFERGEITAQYLDELDRLTVRHDASDSIFGVTHA